MFVNRVYALAQEKYDGELGRLHIEEVRIGTFLAGVKLSNGLFGVASVVNTHEIHQVEKKDRDFGDFTPLQIEGRTVARLFAHPKETSVVRVLRIAVLNAYFHRIVALGGYRIVRNADPVDQLALSGFRNVVMVGAFNSFIRKIAEAGCQLRVLELDEEAFLPHHKSYFVPADQYREVLPQADLVIVTGLTLVNNSFEEMVGFIPPAATSILIGPSASILPDLFFNMGIDLIGGTRITKPEKLFPLISQGAGGYHLFQYCAEKITICRE
jgi:uncharacterized protein (DUF4213/DUF364 family)